MHESMAAFDRATNIVLVDDDTVDVMNVRRAFAKANIDDPLFVAGDGFEALALLRSGTVPAARRIVLLDLNMPRMSGIEFLRALRADTALATTPVVVLTTSDDPRELGEAYRLHVAGYLLKPVAFESFLQLMGALTRYWTLMEMP